MINIQATPQRKNSIGTIEFYSHGFKVIGVDPRVGMAARSTLEQWVIYGEKAVKQPNGEIVKEKKLAQLYGGYFPGQKEFWFHKGQFRDFQSELIKYQLVPDDFNIVTMPMYTPSEIKYTLKPGRVLRDYQVDAKAFGLAPVENGDHFSKLIAMPVGTGKALSDHIEVITPDGDAAIGSLSVGDMVLGHDGLYTSVLGVYPQEGLHKAWKLCCEDSRSTECNGSHIWTVLEDGETEPKDLITDELIEGMKEGKTYYLPLINPFISDDVPEWLVKEAELIRGLNTILSVTPDGWVRMLGVPQIDVTEQSLRLLGCVTRRVPSGLEFRGNCIPFLFHSSSFGDDYKRIDLRPWIKITSIEEAGYATMTCIEVDNEHKLFVTSEMVVTHNTVTSCGIAAENSQRLVVGVLPKYFKKWLSDIAANLDIKPKQIMGVENTSQLRGLIDMCKTQGTKKLPPVIVITLSTLRKFIDRYEEDPEGCVEDYGCAPQDLWKILDCGMFAIDEAHEHINTVFKVAMYLHGPKFVAMSGTMRTEDPFQEKVQNTLFPQIKRYLKVTMAKYIDVEFIAYGFASQFLPKMRYQAFGRTDYSHTTLEKSIMKFTPVLRDFLAMNCQLIDYSYLQTYQKGDKCIVYVGTVEMADKMVSVLENRYPDKTINRYCAAEGDEYDDLIKADMTVSTIQSAGTGVDIPNLTVAVCTPVVNSSKSNIQVLGRLRDLGGRKVTMFMPYCYQIQKHHKYMAFRYEIFRDITKSIRRFNYDRPLGSTY